MPPVIAYRNSAAIRLSDVAEVNSFRMYATSECLIGLPSVLLILYRQPGANIIETIDRIKAELPHLEAAISADMKLSIGIDSSPMIRASLHDTELTSPDLADARYAGYIFFSSERPRDDDRWHQPFPFQYSVPSA